ncbi:MAG: IscS subfamily cysteine desulfurase [Gemmatimonadota bacterium]|nr:IscS subfamily cysteine desulfurase [Gemmatimonadota bacterium]
MTHIYLDNQATTPVDPRVLDAMLPFFKEDFGNAASRTHSFGWVAEAAVDRAREQIAELIHADAREIVFTSGATESDNLAIKGVAALRRDRGGHLITQATEHHAVLDSCKALQRRGFDVTVLPVDRFGQIDPAAVSEAIREDTLLVSIMAANNEIGTIQPLDEIGAICRERNLLFHCDAAQAVGKLPIDVQALGIDMLSISAHKLYGPKGVGALYVRSRPRVRLVAEIDGGGHERGMRSGTLNVPGIVGMGAACELAGAEMAAEGARLRGLRERLKARLFDNVDDIHLNGHPEKRLDGNLNVSFEGVDGESLMVGLEEIALSSGSACTSASLEPSYVLRALGVSNRLAEGSIRFGIGRFNTEAEIDRAAVRVIEEVGRLRDISPYPGAKRRHD